MSNWGAWRAKRRTENEPLRLPERVVGPFQEWIAETLSGTFANPTPQGLETAFFQLTAEYDRLRRQVSSSPDDPLYDTFIKTMNRLFHLLLELERKAAEEARAALDVPKSTRQWEDPES